MTGDRADPRPGLVNRRQLLGLAAGVSLTSMVSACSTQIRTDPARLAAATSARMLCREAWGANLPAPEESATPLAG